MIGLLSTRLVKRYCQSISTRTKIRSILNKDLAGVGEQVKVQGWIKSVRKHQNSLTFIELYDGSCARSLQAVVDNTAHATDLSRYFKYQRHDSLHQ